MIVPVRGESPGGVVVVGAFRHAGEARSLVHRLKYHADLGAGRILARAMAARVEGACLVPVPRATLRRLRYGIDPARWLAMEVGRLRGIPVVTGLVPGLWWRRHAGAVIRVQPRLLPVRAVPAGAVLVDDVVTTGATLDAAAALTGATVALAATVALGPEGPGRW
jgi:predicted amidophosphoribosyltransferase